MSDLSSNPGSQQEPRDPSESPSSVWLSLKKAAARLQDWFTIQSAGLKLLVVSIAILIPATAGYSWSVLQRQEQVAEQVKAMSVANGDGVWSYNKKLPVVKNRANGLCAWSRPGNVTVTISAPHRTRAESAAKSTSSSVSRKDN